MNGDEPCSLSDLMEVGSYWKHKVVLTGVKLGLFTVLAEEPRDAKAVAEYFRGDLNAFSVYLNALVALRLLGRRDHYYENTGFSERYLVRGRPEYKGDQLVVDDNYWALWGSLEETLRTGISSLKRPIFHADADNAERLLVGLHSDAIAIAQKLAGMVDLLGVRALLDLGGGAGTYAIAFCEHNPGLTATIFDLPNATRVARRVIDDFGMGDRIQMVDGDFLTDPIQGSWDAVLMSNVLHGQASSENSELLARVYDALEPGGRLIIRDVFMDEGLASPVWGAVFSVNMLLHTGKGRCYSKDEIFGWLTLAGFADVAEVQPGEVAIAVKARV